MTLQDENPRLMGSLIRRAEGAISFAHRAHTLMADHKPMKCWFLHGHNMNYRIEVDSPADAATGMMIEFSKLKAIINREWVDKWDHALLVCEDDDELMAYVRLQQKAYERLQTMYVAVNAKSSDDGEALAAEFASAAPFRVVQLPFPTSIENLTAAAWQILEHALDKAGAQLKMLELFETPSSGFRITLDRKDVIPF